ncbi:MobF family relaxase [Aeoliella sp.]|uniref:MobF family relaxase n=1 Tax=Aeoliella sp. TaxID=2795800 RepID=UPI003CCC0A08
MLLATQSQSITGTQEYFEKVLTQGDYYLGQEISGHWHGKGADILGVGQGSAVTKDEFFALLEGKHPITGDRLTQRLRKDRRPGMDLTFSVPKSVSLAWAILDDERVLQILREAVHETMRHDVEPLMQRRVRQGKHASSKQRTATGKLIYADFLHKTSRPVDGQPDPHLHVHAFVINWTEDNGKHYAAELEEIVRQRPSLQAKFDARLARKLQQLGYSVEHVRYLQGGRLKRGWEIKGVWRSIIEKFSRRTTQIEEYAAEHGIVDPTKKGQLGKLTRDKKDDGQSVAELQSRWREHLTPEEREAFAKLLRDKSQGETEAARAHESERAMKSVEYALEHHLYRQSTVERYQVIATALEHGLTLHPKDVEQALDKMDVICREVDVQGHKRQLVTTRSVLDAERNLIRFARDGRGTRKSISRAEHEFSRDWLNKQQQAAIRYVLQSRDTVMAIIGGAGTGKTALMKEATEAIEKNGKNVFTFAPSTGAKEVLEGEGFKNAQTVEHLIRNTKLHAKLKDQLIWVDEAGLVDVRSMNAVFTIAREQNARVVLSGDPRQHASPRRGEAMRLLEKEAGLEIARTELIQRQRGKYRQAVNLISKGYEIVDQRTGKSGLLAGFDLLDSLGKIKEISSNDRHAELAKTYLGAIEKGKSSLVVAPTHAEAEAATSEIRSQLQQQGKLSQDQKCFTQYRSLNLTEAEKADPRTYDKHQQLVIQFHQNTAGKIKRGDRYQVMGVKDGKVELRGLQNQEHKSLPLNATDRFEVYSENTLQLAVGDKVRFSLGGTTKDKKSRISNGRLDEIKGFDRQGNLILKNDWVVDKDYAHVDLGYVITSHASQGKDRDVAIAAMGSQSLPAINARQFYVTVSRGREDVVLFVDDKAKVRSAIQRSGEQMSATEMVRCVAQTRDARTRHTALQQERALSFRDRIVRWWNNLRSHVQTHEPVGRHRAAAGRDMGQGMGMQPSLSRSR